MEGEGEEEHNDPQVSDLVTTDGKKTPEEQ